MITFDFEKPLLEHEKKLDDLRAYAQEAHIDVSTEIASLEQKRDRLCAEIYAHLTPYQKVQVARHPNRPYSLDYVRLLCEDFIELHGDRRYADDRALVGGFATLAGRRIMLLGHQKGRDTKENLKRNFGMAHPEGYRKAMRLMELADRCGLPIVCLIDTPGAYPGIGAEERGQAEAIAVNLRDMMGLGVPVMCIVIGEGGSGGALGIGIGNCVLIMEHAYYSVISPEGCAAILFRDAKLNQEAANALKLTAQDLLALGIVEEIIPEPLGGAHRNHEEAAARLKEAIVARLDQLTALTPDQLRAHRYEKFRAIGVFSEAQEELVHSIST